MGVSWLCFSLMKVLIFQSYSFSIFFVITEVVLPPFEFAYCLPDLSIDELEVLLTMSLGGDVGGLRATHYMLSMK